MEKIRLNECSEEFKQIKEEWQKKAKDVTLETLPQFLKELTENYEHDYGTICHAVAMGAVAGAWAVERSPQGGITGFQAGCVMWEFIRAWNYSSNKMGLRLIDYDNFLYPQYEDKFDKTITKATWEALQQQAREKLQEADRDFDIYLEAIDKYKKDIAAFVKKYPDYWENREHYDRLTSGNSAEWAEEKEKEKNGFEFAPQEPFCPVENTSPVYQHWLSIVNGQVPFGYEIKD